MNISSSLLILITFLLGGALFLSMGAVLGNISDFSPTSPVKIEIVEFSGGDRYNDSMRFQDNNLVLKHAGGSAVSADSISVQISGKGNAYLGIPGSGGKLVYGDISVYYEHINIGKKNSDFEKNNKEMLRDGVWSPGEMLVLTGNDSLNSSVSSVFVSADGEPETSNNYSFSSNQTLEIRVYQKNKAGNSQLVFKKETAV
ncbi:hypothetical protein MmiAt1_10060 [Methanimicrococcus sp. At1]|uniref:Archaeal Type IV pilin N-terminal domain-containing protein n=1 Tax=Methanimicrococcus hacksteinii TaxID=3028293 RepID=A0ABU3VPT1_9EURY|nr:hypothetical protein [Methanimicrococcus sp. At1]MDV0445428.1 hypothetical protein [Methanimicrococcus sp. At1]